MENLGPFKSRIGLEHHGIAHARRVYWNLPVAQLYEHALRRSEASLAKEGPLVAATGPHTGRSPNDKFLVRESSSEGDIWWGNVNRPMGEEAFEQLRRRALAYVQGRDLFVFDGYAGTDPAYRLPVRIITEKAWHNLFARNMFVREESPEKLESFEPGFVVLDVAGLKADPEVDGTRSSTFIVGHLGQKLVLIGGTEYAGEIKKSIFSVMNYALPKRGGPLHALQRQLRRDPR